MFCGRKLLAGFGAERGVDENRHTQKEDGSKKIEISHSFNYAVHNFIFLSSSGAAKGRPASAMAGPHRRARAIRPHALALFTASGYLFIRVAAGHVF